MESNFCKITGQNLHYLEAGSGIPLILLPGAWVTSKSYEKAGEKLSEKCKVYIPDLYKGKSEFKENPKSVYDYCQELEEFLAKLKISNYYLIGVSGSGIIASHFAEKTSNKPIKLILFSTTFNLSPFFKRRNLMILKGLTKMILIRNFVPGGLVTNISTGFDAMSYFIKHPVQFLKEAFMQIKNEEMEISVPTTLFVAKKDEFFPYKSLIKANETVKNLKVISLNKRHSWFYVEEEEFAEKILSNL